MNNSARFPSLEARVTGVDPKIYRINTHCFFKSTCTVTVRVHSGCTATFLDLKDAKQGGHFLDNNFLCHVCGKPVAHRNHNRKQDDNCQAPYMQPPKQASSQYSVLQW